MNPYEANTIARLMIDDRLREANHGRLVRELKRRERPVAERTAARSPRHHSRRLWSLVHFRHAYT